MCKCQFFNCHVLLKQPATVIIQLEVSRAPSFISFTWPIPCVVSLGEAPKGNRQGSVFGCEGVEKLLRDVVLAEGVLEREVELVRPQGFPVGGDLSVGLMF